MVPFRVDPRSGNIFPTKSLAIKRSRSTSVEQVTYLSMFEGLEEYSFKVLARHRGNLSHISCEFVSHAQVHVKIRPVRSDSPQISVNLLTDIQHPGTAGAVYATVTVASSGDPQNTRLSIIEPEAAAFFELVRVGQQREWLLRLKCQFQMLSLNSRVGVTLEAVDTEFVSIRNIPSTSRYFLDLALLPRSVFHIRLPQEIQIFVSEIALVNSTIYVINPQLGFHTYNSSFLFSQSTKNDELPFNITETGAVVVTKPIDLEALGTDRIEISFTVVDRNNILLSSMIDSKLVIIVLDYNEHDPVISNSGVERSIFESIPIGSEILQIEAHDPDFSATRISFALFDEDKLPFNFSTSKAGSLQLKTALDAETMPAEFHVKVRVSDSGLPFPRSVIVIYVIRILDVNEFSPVFVEKSCDAQLAVTPNGQVQAMTPSGLELGRFFAEDLDREGGAAVRIHLAPTTVSKPCFRVDSDTGRLVLICPNIGLPESTVSIFLEATDGSRTSEEPFELKINLEKAGYGRAYSKSCQPSGIYRKVQEQKQKRTDYEYLLTGLTSIDSFFRRHDEAATPILNIPSVIRVPENLPIGTRVLKFAAKFIDPFKGNRIPQLIYGIESQKTLLATNDTMIPPYQAFRLRGTPISDVSVDEEMILEVAAPIDRETISAFLYSIRVCVLQDSVGPCASSPITILVEDLPDVPPRFVIDETKTSAHTFSVSENEAEGSVIGQVMAVDGDVESKLRFSLGNFKDYFKIDDVNDNRPMPAAPEYRFHVTEGTPPHTIVATVTGKDKDATGHQLHHAIVSGDPDGYFIINPSTVGGRGKGSECFGRVFAVDLDRGANGSVIYEMAQPTKYFSLDSITGQICLTGDPLIPSYEHIIWVTARDRGSPPRFTAQPTAVFVSFLPPISESALSEDDSIHFLSAPPVNLTLSPRTSPGTVLYQIELDSETSPKVNWTFRLVDSSSPTPFAIATLLNHKAVVFLQQWLNATFVGYFHEVEVIVSFGRLIAAQKVTYYIGEGEASSYFSIDPYAGILRVSSQLAAATTVTQRQFFLQIEARDSGSLHTATYNVSVFIHSPDLSRQRLIIEPMGGLNVTLVEHFSDNGIPRFLGQFHVRNALPNEIFSFELANASTRAFSIDRFSGALYATGDTLASAELDREMNQVVRLRVLVRDRIATSSGLRQQRYGEGLVNVHLRDINDHAPVFVGLPYHATFCVKEHSQSSEQSKISELAPSHTLSQLHQACQSNYFKIRYYLQPLDDDEVKVGQNTLVSDLEIDPISGAVRLSGRLDYEQQPSLTFWIVAVDGGSPPLFGRSIVQVTLSPGDYTENTWVNLASANRIQPGGLCLPLRIRAHDADSSSANVNVVYRLLPPLSHHAAIAATGALPFTIDAQTGEILLTRPLPPSNKDFRFFVEACDQPKEGQPLCSEPVEVTVHLAPQELLWPLNLSCSSISVAEPDRVVHVPESASNGTVLFRLNATDADVLEEHSLLNYHLVEDQTSTDIFRVDEKTGDVTLARELDYEMKKIYSLRVEARDRSNHFCHYNLIVHVLDVNDNPPVFDQPIEITSVPENAPIGSLIGKVHATDVDSGELYLASPLDYEHTPRYFLTIEARDGGTPPLSVTTVATINVIDINDNPPYFIGQDALPLSLNDTITSIQDPNVGIFSFEVYENSPVGTQIGRKCESGSCVTRVILETETATPNLLDANGASWVSPRFSLVARCWCATNLGGSYCERPRDACATTSCVAPRICVPSPRWPRTHYTCLCPLPWTGPNCDRLVRLPSDSPSEACFSEACFHQRGRQPLRDHRLSLFGSPKAKVLSQVIPLQTISNGSVRSASLLNFVQGVLPRHAALPTVQSQPYWAESTLSLLPPIPPSTKNTTTSIAAVSDVGTQNPRTSFYRKTVRTYGSNADLCYSVRLDKRENLLAADTAPLSKTIVRRPKSAYTPFPHPMSNGEACTNPVVDLGNTSWEQQTGSSASSAFVIVEPRGLQKLPSLKKSPTTSTTQHDSFCSSATTLTAPPLQDPSPPPSQPLAYSTIRASTLQSKNVDEDASCTSDTIKTNGLTPRPTPPNVPMSNGNSPLENEQRKTGTNGTSIRKPLLETSNETLVGTLKKPHT
ncbi:Protocadherin Fat 4 [Taenia crassiceps]|uniref:Protocadherin Fat 4 n=1 Tax=Taenia crassiceps TaxID=6207 RepID=A0ABR4QQ40_9CEST